MKSMKQLRGLIAGACALVLSATVALAQGSQGTSPLSIAKGGTAASTASDARSNLGLTIGSAVQAWDADLDALAALSGTDTIYRRSGTATWSAVTIGGLLSFSGGTLNVGDAELTALAGLTSAADKCAYFTGSGTAALTDCPSFGRSLMNAANATTARSTLGLVIGTDVQAQDAELAAIAGLTSATDKIPYFTGSGTAALADFGSTIRSWFTTPSSANLRSILSDETGTGAAVFGTAPTIDGLFNISGAVKYSTQSAPAQITANQNDYNPSSVICATSATLLINSDAARDITGLAGGVAGCELRLVNNGSFTITLKEASASSTAANRFATGGDIALAASATVTLLYDGIASRWRMTSPASAGVGGGSVTSVATDGSMYGGTITTSGTLGVAVPIRPGGRLSLTTATPVTTTDLSAQTTIYYGPSGTGSRFVPIYDGTRFVNTDITAELSLALDSNSGHTGYHQSGKNFDLFVFNDSGTIRLGSSPAWTNDTTRADAITNLAGVKVNNASITLRFGSVSGNTVSVSANRATWVGMFRASADGQVDDSRTKRFLWNAYNQKERVLRRLGSGTHTATAGTGWQNWLNSTTYRVEFVRGDDDDPVYLRFDSLHFVASAGTAQVGIDLDGTSTSDADLNLASNSSSTILTVAAAVFNQHVSAGYHFLQLMENPNSGSNTTFYGELSGLQYGAIGYIKG